MTRMPQVSPPNYILKRQCHNLVITCVCLALNVCVSAQASSVRSGSEFSVSNNVIEEVIVTAQKREQALQQVTASIAILSGEFVKNSGIKNISDLGLYSPSVVVSTNGTTGRVYIRGIGNNLDFLGSQGAVAVHRDGVYQSRQWGVFYDFIDVERIEVLRGPQGAIYGRNATGGAINIVSAVPTKDLKAQAVVSRGNFNEVKLAGTVSSALTDNVMGRLAVSKNTRDGFTDNLIPGSKRLGNEDLVTVRGELKTLIGDDFELRLMGRYFVRDTAGTAIVPSVGGLASTLGARPNRDPFEISHNIDTFFETESHELTAIATWDLGGDLALQSTTAHGKNVVDYHLDSDGTEVDAVHFLNGEDHKQFSQELRLYSDRNDNRWAWQTGLFYLSENTSDTGIVFLPALGFDIPVTGKVDVAALALFAQGTYEFTEKFGLTIGLRYSTERKKMTRASVADDRANWNDWTPHVSLEYRWPKNAIAYASITKGFKSGGYNVLGGGERVDPEYVWSYEIGTKTTWFDNRLNVNGAAFYSQYDDQQVNTFTGAGLARIDNAAESTIYGVELEVSAVPIASTEMGIAVSYLNASFDEYLAADPFLGAVNLAGSRLSHAPKYSVSIFGNHTLQFENQGALTAHVDYSWQDKVKYDVFDNDSTNQAAYGILNASAWYTGPNRNWKIGLWARNITDKVYFTSHAKLNFTPDGTVSFTGEPRTYGLELSFNH